MKSLALTLFVFCGLPQSLGAGPRLPSLSSWEMCGRLIQSDPLRMDLEVSPDQLDALKALRADSEMAKIFAYKEKKRRHQRFLTTGQMPSGEGVRREVTLELEGVVRTRLSAILSRDQLDVLPVLVLKERFQQSYKVFLDAEVQSHCGFDAIGLMDVIRQQKKRVEDQSADAARHSCRRLVAKLAPPVQTRVVYYLGAERFPSIQISREDEEELERLQMPFPPHSNSFLVLNDASVRSTLGINEQQVRRLQTLQRELSEAVSRLKPPTPPNGVEEYTSKYFGLHAKHAGKADQMLSRTQRQSIGRRFAFGEYMRDPTRPFARRNFITYLSASKEVVDAARQAAVAERFSLYQTYRSLNRECFYKLSEQLQPEARSRLSKLFEGVWED